MAIDYEATLQQLSLVREQLERISKLAVVGESGVHAEPYMTSVPFTAGEILDLEDKFYTLKNDLTTEVCKL